MLPAISTFTLKNATYPELLREISDPPPVLHLIGSTTVLEQPMLAIVGSRDMTSYGERVCRYLVTELCRYGITIVSGLAKGIDAVAHRTALECGGTTLAVVANGLHANAMFPQEHLHLAKRICEQGGAIISEYPSKEKARRYYFPARNRIIAGVSLGIVVVEARKKSGALITAKLALEANREVFAVPGSIFSNRSEGTLQLLQQGALPISSVNDIINHLSFTISAPLETCNTPPAYAVTTSQEQIIKYLEDQSYRIENLASLLDISTKQLSIDLTDLEIKGIVRRNIDFTYSLLL